jgi:electron transport complex protein RnfB
MTAAIIMAVIAVAIITAVTGAVLAWLQHLQSNDAHQQLVERVNALLPQTQCAQCGYPGCRPYAEAIIDNDAPVNQCPPGGEQTIQHLAQLLGRQTLPLDEERGTNKPQQLAVIDEDACIGCTLCILACPVDAIVGAAQLMHTVVAADCTGCELCLPPCPVDCISLKPVAVTLADWPWPRPV